MANINLMIPFFFEGKRCAQASESILGRVKTEYWDRWRADEIENQSVANLVVDWLYRDGAETIGQVQEILHVEPDGIVGDETLRRLNQANQLALFRCIKSERMFSILESASTDPGLRPEMKKQFQRLEQFRFYRNR